MLSFNQNALNLLKENLEENKDKIQWSNLSYNTNAIQLLEKNIDKINWYSLSANMNAISLIPIPKII